MLQAAKQAGIMAAEPFQKRMDIVLMQSRLIAIQAHDGSLVSVERDDSSNLQFAELRRLAEAAYVSAFKSALGIEDPL
jgi:hypothetical protein